MAAAGAGVSQPSAAAGEAEEVPQARTGLPWLLSLFFAAPPCTKCLPQDLEVVWHRRARSVGQPARGAGAGCGVHQGRKDAGAAAATGQRHIRQAPGRPDRAQQQVGSAGPQARPGLWPVGRVRGAAGPVRAAAACKVLRMLRLCRAAGACCAAGASPQTWTSTRTRCACTARRGRRRAEHLPAWVRGGSSRMVTARCCLTAASSAGTARSAACGHASCLCTRLATSVVLAGAFSEFAAPDTHPPIDSLVDARCRCIAAWRKRWPT